MKQRIPCYCCYSNCKIQRENFAKLVLCMWLMFQESSCKWLNILFFGNQIELNFFLKLKKLQNKKLRLNNVKKNKKNKIIIEMIVYIVHLLVVRIGKLWIFEGKERIHNNNFEWSKKKSYFGNLFLKNSASDQKLVLC